MVTWYCERDLGQATARQLIATDERPPMAQMYASRESFDRIVGVTTNRGLRQGQGARTHP